MKYSTLAVSALSLALLLSTAQPVFANEDDSVEVSASTSVKVRGEGGFPGGKFFEGIRARVENIKDKREDFRKGSTTREEWKERKEEREEERAERKEDHEEWRIEKLIERGESAIEKRIESLRKLKERLANARLVSAEVLASINASLDAEIAKLEALKADIASGTATSTLKADIKSIKKDFRIFMLVEPKAHIAASASRINAVVTQMNQLVVKLEARITEAKNAGTDVSAAETALADMKAKLADAKVQADAAVAGTANLQPDGGDATVRASNLAALKAAREKLVLAHKDLAAARADAAKIRAVVKVKGSLTATTTTP